MAEGARGRVKGETVVDHAAIELSRAVPFGKLFAFARGTLLQALVA